jgi:hypothetical protein
VTAKLPDGQFEYRIKHINEAHERTANIRRTSDDARQHARAGWMQRPLADWIARMADLLLSDRHRPPALLVGSIPEEPFVLT